MHLVPILMLVLGGAIPLQDPMPGTGLPGGGNPAQKTPLDPKTSPTDLLPPAPRLETTVDPFKVDLARVPEVDFQEPLSHQLSKDDATRAIANRLAKIRQLDDKKTDAFQELLIAQRRDLQGLPFVLGNACRTTGDRANLFGMAALVVRQNLHQAEGAKKEFWELFETTLKKAKQEDLPKVKAMLAGRTEPDPDRD